MILVLKLDLDMIKMYHYTENQILNYGGSKVITRTDRHTDRQTDPTEIITYSHTRMVNIFDWCLNTGFLSYNKHFHRAKRVQ